MVYWAKENDDKYKWLSKQVVHGTAVDNPDGGDGQYC